MSFNRIIEKALKGFAGAVKGSPQKMKRILSFIVDMLNDFIDEPAEQEEVARFLTGLLTDEFSEYFGGIVDEEDILSLSKKFVKRANDVLQKLEAKLNK